MSLVAIILNSLIKLSLCSEQETEARKVALEHHGSSCISLHGQHIEAQSYDVFLVYQQSACGGFHLQEWSPSIRPRDKGLTDSPQFHG